MTIKEIADKHNLDTKQIWQILTESNVFLPFKDATIVNERHQEIIDERAQRIKKTVKTDNKWSYEKGLTAHEITAYHEDADRFGNVNLKYEDYLDKEIYCGKTIKFGISGFKGFKGYTEFELNELTIFVGKNNSGKSAAIDAINFVHSLIKMISERTHMNIFTPLDTEKLNLDNNAIIQLFNHDADKIEISLFKEIKFPNSSATSKLRITYEILKPIKDEEIIHISKVAIDISNSYTDNKYVPLIVHVKTGAKIISKDPNNENYYNEVFFDVAKSSLESESENKRTNYYVHSYVHELLHGVRYYDFKLQFYKWFENNRIQNQDSNIELGDEDKFDTAFKSLSFIFTDKFTIDLRKNNLIGIDRKKGIHFQFIDIIDLVFGVIIKRLNHSIQTNYDYHLSEAYESILEQLPESFCTGIEDYISSEFENYERFHANLPEEFSKPTENDLKLLKVNTILRLLNGASTILSKKPFIESYNLDSKKFFESKAENKSLNNKNKEVFLEEQAKFVYNIIKEEYDKIELTDIVSHTDFLDKNSIFNDMQDNILANHKDQTTKYIFNNLVYFVYHKLRTAVFKTDDLYNWYEYVGIFKKRYIALKKEKGIYKTFNIPDILHSKESRIDAFFSINVCEFFVDKKESISATNRNQRQRVFSTTDTALISRYINKYNARVSKLKKEDFGVEPIEKRLQNILYDLGIAKEIKLQRLKSTDYYMIKLINSNTGIEENIRDLGFGYSQILPLIMEKAISDSESLLMYSDEKKILIIEEPETNLHPNLQADLADLIAAIEQPFKIIETHSEYIIRRLQRRVAEYNHDPKSKKGINGDKINIYYFHPPNDVPEGESQVYQIKINEDGSLSKPFGRGFMDEAGREVRLLHQIGRENLN